MKEQQLSTRIFWADLVRIAASIGVVSLHTIELPYTLLSTAAAHETGITVTLPHIFSLLLLLFGKTGVPLFILLSGSLLLSIREKDSVFFHKRIKRIILPWVVWTGLFCVTKYWGDWDTLATCIQQFFSVLSAEFTFIPVLFSLYILTPFLRVLVAHLSIKKLGLLILLWFCAISVLPFWRNSLAFPLSVDNGIVRQTISYLGYFLAGVFITEQKLYMINKTTLKYGVFLYCLLVAGGVYIVLTIPQHWQNILSYTSPLTIIVACATFALFSTIQTRYTEWASWIRLSAYQMSIASFGVFFSHTLITPIVKEQVSNFLELSFSRDLAVLMLTLLISFALIIVVASIPKLRPYIT